MSIIDTYEVPIFFVHIYTHAQNTQNGITLKYLIIL